MSRPGLLAAVVRFVDALPASSVERAALAAESAAGPGEAMVAAIPQADYQREASRLLGAWRVAEAVPGSELAAMLRAASAARASALRQGRVEVVWTGPGTYEVPSRATEAVVLEVVAAASRELLLVTYAAFRYPPLVAALEGAAERRVRVQVLIETRAGASGLLGQEPASAFAGIPGLVLYHWPATRRVTDSGAAAVGRMHAKVLVADRELAFVTSANLTGNGIEENLECGLLVHGGPVPGQLVDHVRNLMRRGVFQPLEATSQ